ncbi:hypothetical protein VMCG_08706 [Cytospora schulzeri]|uniref:Uncharacterized protein n=1 Tax=Cytospora schulzeri TaxID=448051 RepID=A0A423VQ69_9PEZI|nr:hypothetical protein VMCG_08706 [Valsa malicola]
MSRSIPTQPSLNYSAQAGARVEGTGAETVGHDDQGPGPGATRLWFGRHTGTRLDELQEGYKRALLRYVKETPYPNLLRFQRLHEEFEEFKRRKIEQIQASLDDAEDFINHDEPGATLLWFGEHEGLVKYCNLHKEYIKWLDERQNRSPLSTVIWFGTYYRGYEIRKIFHNPKKWNWFLAHCPERLDFLLEIQERYSRWLARQPRRRRPIDRAPPVIVNRVGRRLGAQDDGVASDNEQEYEADGFVVPDSQYEEEGTEDEGDDDSDSDAPWNRNDQVDPADELKRELADLNDEVLDETTDMSGEGQNDAVSSGADNGYNHQNPSEPFLEEENLPLPLLQAQRCSPVPDINGISKCSQAKKQTPLPLKQQRPTRKLKLGEHLDKNRHREISRDSTSHVATPSAPKRRRLLSKSEVKLRPNAGSSSDEHPLVHATGGDRSEEGRTKTHSEGEETSDKDDDDEHLQSLTGRWSTRTRRARLSTRKVCLSSSIGDSADTE